MKFEYWFNDNEPYFTMEIKPNENIKGCILNISDWLSSDVPCFDTKCLSRMKEILRSDIQEEEVFWGNAYRVVIHKDFTTISYNFEYANPKRIPCTLPTEMLCEILEIWIKAEAEHRAKVRSERKKSKKI